jgi:hypothetical protein
MNRRSFLKVFCTALLSPFLAKFKKQERGWTFVPMNYNDADRQTHLYVEKFHPHVMEVSHYQNDEFLEDVNIIPLGDDAEYHLAPATLSDEYGGLRVDGMDVCKNTDIKNFLSRCNCPMQIEWVEPCSPPQWYFFSTITDVDGKQCQVDGWYKGDVAFIFNDFCNYMKGIQMYEFVPDTLYLQRATEILDMLTKGTCNIEMKINNRRWR